MSQTIGSAIAVHRVLGPGFVEKIYRRAMCIELEARNLAYEKERSIRVNYRGIEIPGQRVDLIIEGLIVVGVESCYPSRRCSQGAADFILEDDWSSTEGC
jgi:GxxExxY protein